MKHSAVRKCGIMIIAVALCVAFAGCGSGGSETKDTKTDKKPDKQITVVSQENREQYNFAEEAEKYMNTIGTEYINRNLSLDEKAGKTPNRHEQAKEWILSELKKAGYDGDNLTVDEFEYDKSVNKKTGTNIVATIPGQDRTRQVIAGAHYDGDGTGDNGSGVALLLANACGLAKEKPKYTVRFVFFDGEEDGMLGSTHYVEQMTQKEKKGTLYMINMDSLAFGDYCNIYGGVQNPADPAKPIKDKEAYEYAMKKAAELGFRTYGTKELNGYFARHKKGPKTEVNALYTNPWTYENQSPENFMCVSPTTIDASDHAPFKNAGIRYVYFEATNWYAKGDGGEDAYTGYYDTDRKNIGESGMFMNTKYDTLEIPNKYFPGRAWQHFDLYSPLLSGLLLDAGGIELQGR